MSTPFDHFEHMTADEFEAEVVVPAEVDLALLDAQIAVGEQLLAHMEGCPHSTAGDALACMEGS